MNSKEDIKIAVVGIGYVGLSNSLILAQNNEVVALDICNEKVQKINNSISPLAEKDTINFLKEKRLNLKATTNPYKAISDSKYVVISTPTDYDEILNSFNTSSIESVIEDVMKINRNALIIIKSTVPIGYTKEIKRKYKNENIIFSPEFLREGSALHDNLNPSRIIMGEESERAKKFANLLKEGAVKENIVTLFMDSDEAEAVKLFSNTYLAMRVAFFNELDTFAQIKNIESQNIIKGMSHDSRIGPHYNNPSFGFGGYCLPKDTKQMKANFKEIPSKIISAIVDANRVRKDFIADLVIKTKPKAVGIHRLIMKTGADNIRTSAIQGIIERIKKKNIDVIIYEPELNTKMFSECQVIDSLDDFKNLSDVIITNRYSEDLDDVKNKVITRDQTGKD